jgi:hypothetical protein
MTFEVVKQTTKYITLRGTEKIDSLEYDFTEVTIKINRFTGKIKRQSRVYHKLPPSFPNCRCRITPYEVD